eukprot:g714.t1
MLRMRQKKDGVLPRHRKLTNGNFNAFVGNRWLSIVLGVFLMLSLYTQFSNPNRETITKHVPCPTQKTNHVPCPTQETKYLPCPDQKTSGGDKTAERYEMLKNSLESAFATGKVTPSKLSSLIQASFDEPKFKANDPLANSLKECYHSVQYENLPEFEVFSQHYCGQDHSSFVPLRRESAMGKLLYCFGKEPSMKKYVDIFASWGGGTLLLAHGMSNSEKSSVEEKTLVGWEIDSTRHNGLSGLVDRYIASNIAGTSPIAVDMRFGSTMVEKTIKGTIEKVSGGKGDWVDYCTENNIDFVLSDSGAGTRWTRDDGKLEDTQELFITRDLCKPQVICLMNIYVDGQIYHADKQAFYQSMKKSEEWELLVEGSSGSVGCLDTMFNDRYFACFQRLK